MICFMFGMHLIINFSVFLFSILCSLFVGGKHVSSKLRNCLPMFDATCLLYGGLNHVMFLFLLFLCLLFWLLLCVSVGLYSNL